MYYFKFISNSFYFLFLTINILINKNKSFIHLDSYINYKILFKSNTISNSYNNTISFKQYLNILDYFNL